MAETVITAEPGRAQRKQRVGVVIANKMAKTITVEIMRRYPHPQYKNCLLYTSDAADDLRCVDLGGRRIIKKNNH